MKTKLWKTYAFWVLLAEAAGLLAGLLTREDLRLYSEVIAKPPLSPPAFVFPIVWTLLYALMGIGAARMYLAPASQARKRGLLLFLVQLVFNFCWSFIFFRFQAFDAAFVWLLALFVLVLGMTSAFRSVDPLAARLQTPYLLWLVFAGYLSAGVWLLNR